MTGARVANFEALAVEEALATMGEKVASGELRNPETTVKHILRFLSKIANAWSIFNRRHQSDVLTREQLPAWFAQVRQIQNPCIAAALQVMLLTGARPGEVMGLRWEDLKTQWRASASRTR